MEELGKDLFHKLECSSCHADDGLSRGPSLVGIWGTTVKTRAGAKVAVDANYIRNSIVNPSDDIIEKYQQVMPSYRDQLTEEQLLQLSAYIRSLGKAPAGENSTSTISVTSPPQQSSGIGR